MYWCGWERRPITLEGLLPRLLENAGGLGSLVDSVRVVRPTVFCRHQLLLLWFWGGSESGDVGGITVPTALAAMWFGCLGNEGFTAALITLPC